MTQHPKMPASNAQPIVIKENSLQIDLSQTTN